MSTAVPPPDQRLSPRVERVARAVLEPLRRYHRFRTVGLEHLPATGPALLVVSHSLATYDGLLLGLDIYDHTNRTLSGLGDRLLFRNPFVADAVRAVGLHEASTRRAQELLAAGHLLGLTPGGMRESLRPSTHRYQVRWSERLGFVRLAIATGTPIVLAACPAADDIYTVYDSALTRIVYERFRVPMPVMHGVGPTLLPRPIPLTYHLSEPMRPPEVEPSDPHAFDAAVVDMHRHVIGQMEALIGTALRARRRATS